MRGRSGLKTAVLLTLWGVGTIAAFWLLEGQYLRPVTRPAGAMEAHPEDLPLPPFSQLSTNLGVSRLQGPGPVTLLNFWNPDCACSRFAEAHVHRLVNTYARQGVRFLTVVECGSTSDDRSEATRAWKSRDFPDFAFTLDPDGQIARAFGVWAAPAAVILNRHGQIAYVGAYNAARFCNDHHTAWAEKALQAILNDLPPSPAKTSFFGCQVLSHNP